MSIFLTLNSSFAQKNFGGKSVVDIIPEFLTFFYFNMAQEGTLDLTCLL